MRTLGQLSVTGRVESRRKGMWKQSENIVHRLFTRQIRRARPNTHIHKARELYENIFPSHTVYDVECPDLLFRKFTNDGQYLICFSRNHQDLVVYRHRWLNYCVKGGISDQCSDLPAKAKKFESYFVQIYSISLASGSEVICKDFFLATENNLYGIFATSTVPDNSAPVTEGALDGVPSIEKITILLVRLSDGHITDERVYQDDFIHLAHNSGVFLYDDLLAVLSIRYQCIRVLQIRDSGRFVDVRSIGAHCREDDELVLNSQAQDEESYQRDHVALRKARGLPAHADVSASKRVLNSQGNTWPLEWNLSLKHGTSSKGAHVSRSRASKSSSFQSPSSVTMSPPPHSENASGSASTHANGIYGGVQGADLDLQYDHYFRGLFASLDENSVGHSNPVVIGGAGPSGEVSVANAIREHRPVGPILTPSSGTRNSYGGMEVGTALAPHEHARGRSGAIQTVDGSMSGSRGHHMAVRLTQNGRSQSTGSGDSLDRYRNGRLGYPARYTSTTGTSNDSGSRSDGSHWEASVSGGSVSYGNGTGPSGSVSMHSSGGNPVEYVVSSRSPVRVGYVQQSRLVEDTSLSNMSLNGCSDMRNNVSSTSHQETGYLSTLNGESSAGVATSSEHHRRHVTVNNLTSTEEMAQGNERFLPSRFSGERPVSGSERAGGSAGALNHPHTFNRVAGAQVTEVLQGRGTRSQAGRRSWHNADNNGGTQQNGAAEDQGSPEDVRAQVLGGIKQRLLSFIFQDVWNRDIDPALKAQRLNWFYYRFQQYTDLVMWKMQFLDRYHLLIKFGSVDGVVQRNSDTPNQISFLAVYNLETTEMLGFYQNNSEDFFLSLERFCDHFRVQPRYPLYMNFISSYSNNSHAREQLRKQKLNCPNTKAGSSTLVAKKTLTCLPFTSQCQSPSVYFDQSLFHYDEKLISAMDRHKPCLEHPIKFISRRRPNLLKFKINPGPEHGSTDGRSKRVASFMFHPIFPFAISIQQSLLQPPIINFHFRK